MTSRHPAETDSNCSSDGGSVQLSVQLDIPQTHRLTLQSETDVFLALRNLGWYKTTLSTTTNLTQLRLHINWEL